MHGLLKTMDVSFRLRKLTFSKDLREHSFRSLSEGVTLWRIIKTADGFGEENRHLIIIPCDPWCDTYLTYRVVPH